MEGKTLVIEWQRLLDENKQTCPRCGSTEQEVEKAVKELTGYSRPMVLQRFWLKNPSILRVSKRTRCSPIKY